MSISEKSVELHGEGFNCAQSVLISCGDYTGLDKDTAAALSAGFGGGVRAGEVCGSISGAAMVVGKVLTDSGKSSEIAAVTKELVKAFRENYGSARCFNLKKSGHSCDELIAFAAEYADKIIKEYEVENGNL